jgi:hypothetical protein
MVTARSYKLNMFSVNYKETKGRILLCGKYVLREGIYYKIFL